MCCFQQLVLFFVCVCFNSFVDAANIFTTTRSRRPCQSHGWSPPLPQRAPSAAAAEAAAAIAVCRAEVISTSSALRCRSENGRECNHCLRRAGPGRGAAAPNARSKRQGGACLMANTYCGTSPLISIVDRCFLSRLPQAFFHPRRWRALCRWYDRYWNLSGRSTVVIDYF